MTKRKRVPSARAACALAALCCTLAACDGDPITPRSSLVPVDSLLAEPIELVANPSGRAPLTALATVRTREAAVVELRLLGGDSLGYAVPGPATEHVLPVLGLHPARENLVEVRVENARGEYGLDTLSVATGPAPDFLPHIDILTADRAAMEPGWNLASFSLGVGATFRSYPFMFDAEGKVRWYLDLSALPGMVYMVERLRNGNLVFGFDASVYEYDLLGREVGRWDFPGYVFHHDVVEKPDGNFLVAVTKQGTGTIEDHVIELDRATGRIAREWDLRKVLDVDRRVPPGFADWFHMNSVWFDARDNSLILSGRHQGVVKVSAENELVWILAPHVGWGGAGIDGTGPETSGRLLTAVDATGTAYPEGAQLGGVPVQGFDWPWAQHAAMVLPNGNLFLFDNGEQRNFAPAPLYSRGVEYAIDEQKRTVRQVWEYGKERGTDYYSAIVSDVDYLPKTGNRLIVPGIVFGSSHRAHVTEVAHPSGRVVFDARLSFKNLRSSGVFEWGEFDLLYRAERLAPYPAAN
ncbi:MAG: aryl-sulfate sulfotransferase [Gemmatimonadota bacterium]